MSVRAALGVACVLSAGMACGLSGCHSQRGGMMPSSWGSTTYYSTETQQKTITLVDVRTGEQIFVIDVPPGKQLTLDFLKGQGDDPVYTPDLMRYQMWDQGTIIGRLTNSMSVPNAASRRIDVNLTRAVAYAEAPAEERLRVDQEADRPDWWTQKGGPMPEKTRPVDMYDN